MATSAASLSSLSSLSIRTPPSTSILSASSFPPTKLHTALKTKPSHPSLPAVSSHRANVAPTRAKSNDIDTSFFDNLNPEEEVVFEPVEPPEGFVPPPAIDEGPFETEDEITAAYEERYGPAYSGVSVLGNDIYVMDSTLKKKNSFGKIKVEKVKDGLEERVVEVRRVNKVVKGGRQLNFRVVVVVGDKRGQVGVGVAKAKEIIAAVQKSAIDARRNIVTVPITKYSTFPHRSDGKFGAAKVMLRPACPGSGVLAGGAVRAVLEMAGLQNALGKQLGSDNLLNNARATIVAVQKMRHFRDVALERGIPMEELWK
ncbi:small ribosomal subunit protein uS5c [Malania oleifera]|uniref:small ribosomal subunit protein uS5c n=1 Tax=Malania oleifera TaxID=397392 RepID=UPI0025AE25CC|nr:small ribosomal subunit protein uS5c [Malania oleifera]